MPYALMNDAALIESLKTLRTRPGHETVRVHLGRILLDRLGAKPGDLALEAPVPEVRGRIDALVGRTVIEIKSNLDRERGDADAQLRRYLPDRKRDTGHDYVGIATDGRDWTIHEMRGDDLTQIASFRNVPPRGADEKAFADEFLVWIESVLAIRDRLPATATAIIANMGRASTPYMRAISRLMLAWREVRDDPEAKLKRQLWEDHLRLVYGADKTNDGLWLSHTYLVMVAKTIAAAAMGVDPREPDGYLTGEPFRDAGIEGAVEADFFDWVLRADAGRGIIRDVAGHAARFDLGAIEVDLLKILYEALIDPEDRHDLGEYYTPDWLADRTTEEALGDRMDARVLDPSCGSGTFLFHAIRRKCRLLEAAGVPSSDIAMRCLSTTFGFDVHPVAVIIARVTALLALGPHLRGRGGAIALGVHMGNALQWNVREDEDDLVVTVPDDGSGATGLSMMRFPLDVAARPDQLGAVLDLMERGSEAGWNTSRFENQVGRMTTVPATATAALAKTYGIFHRLREAGRDHVWTYVVRNLARPIALRRSGGVDLVLGNPPWLSYRYMSNEMQRGFAAASRDLDVWVAADEGKLVTQIDLSGYFFARAVELYLQDGGRIAMVMPLAAMTRGQFRAFRSATWTGTRARFTDAWVLDNQEIAPLFTVPTCVLFAEKLHPTATPGTLPDVVTAFQGRPPRKDASRAETYDAKRKGRVIELAAHAPAVVSYDAGSPYRSRFHQGATLVPRMMCYIERAEMGRLGGDPSAPQVVSKRSKLEKLPWKELLAIEGPVEAQFLRTAYLGESIAPFRVLDRPEAVVPVMADPVGDGTVWRHLDAERADAAGMGRLADWLRDCERLWGENAAKKSDGRPKLSLRERFDYQGGLRSQFPVAPIRVAFSASGTKAAAVVIQDASAAIEHALYWCATETVEEARYLAAILNAEEVRARVEHMQSRGEQGARHFDKLFFTLPIPRFDRTIVAHMALSDAAVEAERVAAGVVLDPAAPFTTKRAAIRDALLTDGIAGRIDALVADLLGRAGIADKAIPIAAE